MGTEIGAVTEFIYLHLKPTVKLEEPGNDGGRDFWRVVDGTKNQIGYVSSSWGRSLEDESLVVWVIGSSTHIKQ